MSENSATTATQQENEEAAVVKDETTEPIAESTSSEPAGEMVTDVDSPAMEAAEPEPQAADEPADAADDVTAEAAVEDATPTQEPDEVETPVASADETDEPHADVKAEQESSAVDADSPESEPFAEPVADASDDSADAESTEEADQPQKGRKKPKDGRVVRLLAVGQEVDGVVKRTTEFGAFVDIGVGRDGLIHISELAVRRVGKVTDVVNQGDKVTAWIKELDRKRNRISLTLISPETKTIRDLEKGEIVKGTVTRTVPYGAFVDLGVGRDALLHIREMAEGFVAKPEDVVQVGEEIEARIIDLSRRRGRIDLSLKGLRPEPEVVQEAAPVEEDEEFSDEFADMEVLSPMELAFKKAMGEDVDEVESSTRKRSKKARREDLRAIQDEIISRTLDTGPKK